MTSLRTAARLYTRSKGERGFSTTPNRLVSTVSRYRSGRATALSLMMMLLVFLDFVGEQHVVDPLFERARCHALARLVREAVELSLHLSWMRRKQQDAASDLHRLGNRVGDEEHGEMRVVPQLQQFVLHLAPRER